MTDQPSFCAEASEWFHAEEIGAGIWLISEPGHANAYLITSPNGSVLFDSGTGLAPISQVISKLATGPLTVLNSHSHLDHIGGNADIMMNAAELGLTEILAHPSAPYADSGVSTQFLTMYADSFTRIAEEYAAYRKLDDTYFYAQAQQPVMRAMPNAKNWRVPVVQPHRRVQDGEVLNVGNREFVVVHLPGHTPDSQGLYEPATKSLFAGDSIITAAMWFHGEDANLNDLVESMKKLEQLEITTIYCAHNLITTVDSRYIVAVRTAAEQVLAGHTTPTRGHDLLGTNVDKHTVNGISILLPATTQGASA